MSFSCLRLETDARGVATLTLARPEKHNAFSGEMIDELASAAKIIAEDPGVRVCLLRADGASFCAGADLRWMSAQLDADRQQRMAEARKLAMMLNALNTSPKPLVARVQGNVFGGGVGLLATCDVVIASEEVRLGLTETRLGLIPATISPYVAARIGEPGARRVALSGRLFDAREGEHLGLISKVVAAEKLDDAVEAEIGHLMSAKPQASAATKMLFRGLGPTIDEAVIERTITRLADQWETDEAKEGIRAFLDKRLSR